MADTASKSSSSRSSNKSVWSAIDAVVDYVTRHGDEGGVALRATVADLAPGKTQETGEQPGDEAEGDHANA